MANEKNSALLGINFSTATSSLRKQIIFYLAGALDLLKCFQCKGQIETVEEFSIEHKTPWRTSADPKSSFFDINNIAFSHLFCNIGAAEKSKSPHGAFRSYRNGCRCDKCTLANKKHASLVRGRYKAIYGITRPREQMPM